MTAIVVMLAAGFAFLGAAVFLASAARALRRGLLTRSWARAEGRVVRSAVARETEATGEGTVDVYRAEVRYRYEAAGAARTGSAVRADDGGSPSRSRAERTAARYPEGARVAVFYDPADPDRAVLERGAGSRPVALLLWGALCLAGGLLVLRVLCGLGGDVPGLVARACAGSPP
ncbi:MAG TPA: DUF3592 domain-containing protein [Longimicrobiaceae bacterium]|jgi:hypothetical protein